MYLATVGCSVAATVLVSAAHRCAYAGLALLGLALTGVTVIIFDAVSGTVVALAAGACALALLVLFWMVLPFSLRNRDVQV